MISKILVPTDGSKTAQKAAAYAIGLAKQLHASIIIMCVVDKRFLVSRTVLVEPSSRYVTESIEDYQQEAAERYAREIKKLCGKKGIQSRTVIKQGHPVEEITKQAEKSKVGLIAMGSHGQSALAAATLGSVTYGVIHKDTTIPVLVVRR
ncbi:MAG: universal stress protein [Sedimentisphaerales bacterium]|jgi:nucleotide-binding universal stress UspA family protein